MEPITLVLIGITVLFFMLLAIKSIFNIKKACIICLSITLTWITLLALYFLDIFADKIIIAILMGHTSLGIFYILEKKVKKKFLLFRLPYLLTSILIIYYVLNGFVISSLYFILVLWILFFIVYLLKNNKLANKIIECCKKW
ncbi:MAG: hypothetical protein AABX50_01360 [Nanoarchaeota archaeon]